MELRAKLHDYLKKLHDYLKKLHDFLKILGPCCEKVVLLSLKIVYTQKHLTT